MSKHLLVFYAVPSDVSPLVQEWIDVVKSEGEFEPIAQEITPSNWNHVFLMERLHMEKPIAVQFIGRIPMFPTGFTAYDGHESRCVWGDVPYTGAFINSRMTDSKSNPFTRTTPEPYRNTAGDLRFDNVFGGRMLWPVGRIDFSRIGQFNSAMKRPDGKVCWPAVDEVEAFKDYFRRNIEYRRKRPSMTSGYVCGGNFTAAHMKRLQSRCPGIQWVYKTSGGLIAGLDVDGFVYGSLGSRYWYKYESGGKMLSAFWHNCHSSKQYEYLHDGAGIRRSLTWSLVSTWGYSDAYWSPVSSDRTVADVAVSSWSRYGSIPLSASLCGDLTLKLPHCRWPAR